MMATSEYDPEEFARLFEAALDEADRAARRAKPGLGFARDQAPLVAVDHYVEGLMAELAELRAYQSRLEEWLMSFPIATTALTATVGVALDSTD